MFPCQSRSDHLQINIQAWKVFHPYSHSAGRRRVMSGWKAAEVWRTGTARCLLPRSLRRPQRAQGWETQQRFFHWQHVPPRCYVWQWENWNREGNISLLCWQKLYLDKTPCAGYPRADGCSYPTTELGLPWLAN